MINLLSPDLKSRYSYARRNVVLRKWVTLLLIALIGLGAIATFGLLSLKQSNVTYEKQIATTEALFKEEKFAETQKRIQEISGSFKLVVQVLSQEVLFSRLLRQIGTTIPAQATLTGLNISQTQGAIDISANAIDYETATQVQINLADPRNKIFSKADIVSISCEAKPESAEAGSLYPCTVNVRALFAPDNPYLFINSKGKSNGQ